MFHRIVSLIILSICAFQPVYAQPRSELRFVIRAEPKTFDPFEMASEEASETIRFLTSGVLIRLDRQTQKLEPALASEWKVIEDGRGIEFKLRQGVSFSDGSPFTASDVAFTMRRLMAPETRSPVADSFRSAPGEVEVEILGDELVRILFPAPVANLAELFDEVTVVSALSPEHRDAVLGPFVLESYRPGVSVRLVKNSHYWKHDDEGQRLPYLQAVRLDIQRNQQLESLRFQRGQIDLIPSLSPTAFERLRTSAKGTARDGGPSFDVDFMWFNQNPNAPIQDNKRKWFASRAFRSAISEAINRDDLCRIAFCDADQSPFVKALKCSSNSCQLHRPTGTTNAAEPLHRA